MLLSVSIADATLASPQPAPAAGAPLARVTFQSQTRRLLPRNVAGFAGGQAPFWVSIADATLASPQQRDDAGDIKRGEFQSQTRRLLPRNAQKPRAAV